MTRGRKGRSTAGSTWESQMALQNSHDSTATSSSPSCGQAGRSKGSRAMSHKM